MEGDHRLPKNTLTEASVAEKPLRRCSNLVVATARREIHGNKLHCTVLPPTLQGFFHGCGHGNGEVLYDDEQDNLVPRHFGQFASLFGTSATTVIDPSFSFLTAVLPRTDHIFLVHSCNGLLLLGRFMVPEDPDANNAPEFEFGYIVCNPATEQWTAVPTCNWMDDDPSLILLTTHTSLFFDPAVSSHFQLVLFWDTVVTVGMIMTTVHTYSSRTGIWSHSEIDWSEEERRGPWEGWRRRQNPEISILFELPSAFVDGLTYLIFGSNRILKVDAQGKTQDIIPVPAVYVDSDNYAIFVGQSQGLLHCIIEEGIEEIPYGLSSHYNRKSYLGMPPPVMLRSGRKWKSYGLSVWVLRQNSDEQEWVLKHRMSNQQLFGKSCESMADYHVVTIHPDCNMILFMQRWDAQLIAYDIDRQEVCALQSFQDGNRTITLTPFIPYFSELFLGVIGAHKEALVVL